MDNDYYRIMNALLMLYYSPAKLNKLMQKRALFVPHIISEESCVNRVPCGEDIKSS